MIGRLKNWIKATLGFSRTETNGFLILLPLVAMIIFAMPVYTWWVSLDERDFSTEKKLLDSLAQTWTFDQLDTTADSPTYFDFDPNTATIDDFMALGFPGNLAQRIINYRAKGGKFKNASDLKKIYGIDTMLITSLSPYINIAQNIQEQEISSNAKPANKLKSKSDINFTDTTTLKKIYGIGSTLATRIVKYRDKLGGLIRMEQLYEVYGLDSVVVLRTVEQFFVDSLFAPKKLNLNTAEENDLSDHPYFTRQMARAIITFRFQHGNYKSIDDLQQIKSLSKAQIDKVKPYLIVLE